MLSTNYQDTLTIAAGALQYQLAASTGTIYPTETLMSAVSEWFEQSCQQLAHEAVYHCCTGDRAYAQNRPAFDEALRRLTPTPYSPLSTPQRQPQTVAAFHSKPKTRSKKHVLS